MRDGGSDALYRASGYYSVSVSSWLGATLLAQDVPLLSGRLTADSSQQVPERLTFSVPRFTTIAGVATDWLPGSRTDHPLARFGQQLSVAVTVASAGAGTGAQTRLGRYAIQEWSEGDDGTISVDAAGILQLVADDRLTSPTSPRAGATLVSELTRLLPAWLSCIVDSALVDRACPSAMDWNEDRLAALYDIADAWPARLRASADGTLTMLAPLANTPTPVVSLTDGVDGVVVAAPRADTREGIYNRVVSRAESSDPAAVPVQAVVDATSGPMSTSGPYGIVTRFFSSPLISTEAQARTAGTRILLRSMLSSRTLPVELIPDPRIDLDDAISVTRDGVTHVGYVTAYDLPLTALDGSMRVDVGIVEGTLGQ